MKLTRRSKHEQPKIPLTKLGTVRFRDLPNGGRVEIGELPFAPHSCFLTVAIFGQSKSSKYVQIEFTVQFAIRDYTSHMEAAKLNERKIKHLRRFFKDTLSELELEEYPEWTSPSVFVRSDLLVCHLHFARRLSGRHLDWKVADLVAPFVKRFRAFLKAKETLLFLCHASEDKPFVERLCKSFDKKNVDVWYDKREIKTGQSIVSRVSDGLAAASHLVFVLSRRSVKKPWVLKEMSATLMKQLHDNSIVVLPVMIEDCEPPRILVDIKYADFRSNFDVGMNELLAAI